MIKKKVFFSLTTVVMLCQITPCWIVGSLNSDSFKSTKSSFIFIKPDLLHFFKAQKCIFHHCDPYNLNHDPFLSLISQSHKLVLLKFRWG